MSKDTNSSLQANELSDSAKYIILCIYGISLGLFGILIDPPKTILNGLYRIVLDPDFLITDYIGIGGIGSAFVNSGLLTLITIYVLYRLKIRATGATISTVWLMSGFSLFGKNIFNIWFIMLGVFLYSKYQHDKFTKYVYVAFLGTSLSPTVTQVMFGMGINRSLSIPLGILTGLVIGLILPPLAAYLMRVHQGFNLYNIGFTSGIIGTILVSLFRSYGLVTEARLIWTSGNNHILAPFLIMVFCSMIILGFFLNNRSLKGWINILRYPGKLVTDFVILDGFAPSLINMGINGILSTFYIILVRGDLNGPTIGGIFTIVGFSSFGKHIKNVIPIFMGVFLGAALGLWDIKNPVILLSSLFATTLAPIPGEFGWQYGVIAGFIQSCVALNVGYLHGGFNLYNSGFAGGIVAAAMVPVIEAFRKDEI